MNLIREWRDFLIFPDGEGGITRETRFNLELVTSGSFAGRSAHIVTKSEIVWSGDEFEAMRVDDAGNVEIWTTKKVWTVNRRHGTEKLLFIARHPYEEQASGD
jgi:hypothetical protein